MTFRVNLYADQAFLSMIKRTIKRIERFSEKTRIDHELEEVASGIILCQSAFETFLNLLTEELQLEETIKDKILKANFLDKIELWHQYKPFDYNKTKLPWQDIKRLNSVRNWLVHFKTSNISLISSSSGWINDGINKIPKFDDAVELKLDRLKSYYSSVITCMYIIAKTNYVEDLYEHLKTEKYFPLLVG